MTTIEELDQQIDSLPDGEQKIALIEEKIRLYDLENNLYGSYETRNDLMDTCLNLGYPIKTLMAFSWNIAKWDIYGEELEDAWSVLWKYKWIVYDMFEFPQISREQMNRLLADMKEKYQKYGYSLRPYYYYRFSMSKACGYLADMHKYFELWQQTEPDSMSCLACETSHLAIYHVDCKEYEKALKVAQPIMDGKLRCNVIPHRTFAALLEAWYQLGQFETAEKFQKKDYSLIANNQNYVEEYAMHLNYFTKFDLKRAVAFFEKTCKYVFHIESAYQKLLYYQALLRLLNKLKPETRLRLPISFPESIENPTAVVLADWFHKQANEIAKQFDQRNGNDYLSRMLAEK